MRLDLIQQILAPRITMRDIERELRSLLIQDPMKMERAVGTMYGTAFKKAEVEYASRGSRGHQEWSWAV